MACFASCAVFTVVYVIDAMTRVAIRRGVLISLVDMAQSALIIQMGTGQPKISILIMIEFCVSPVGLLMAAFTVFSELPVMIIIVFMAAKTLSDRAPVFFVWFMTPITRRGLVRACKRKIRELMVKSFIIQPDDVRIASFMLGMAG